MHMVQRHLWRQNTNAHKISKFFGLFVLGFLRGKKATEVDIPSGRRFTGKGKKTG